MRPFFTRLIESGMRLDIWDLHSLDLRAGIAAAAGLSGTMLKRTSTAPSPRRSASVTASLAPRHVAGTARRSWSAPHPRTLPRLACCSSRRWPCIGRWECQDTRRLPVES